MKKRKVSWKDVVSIYGPGIFLVIAGFYLAQYFIKPAPPKDVRIAAGQETGAYYQFANRYAEFLKKEGITLHVLKTAGSVENIKLLSNGEADIAFIQGGTIPRDNPGRIEGLASLYYEPLWLFHRKDLELTRLARLKGLKVSTGAEGSGTFALVRQLLEENRLNDENVDLVALPDADALKGLSDGSLDAAFFVTRPGSSVITKLMENPDLQVASFERASGYAKRFYYLSALLLPEGSQNLVRNIPDRDIELIAVTASLAVDPDIHPAIVDLIMQAAYSAHHHSGWFEADEQFPSPRYLELPLNDQADRFFKHGPPFLQRYLPFWAASLIDRLKIMLLPLVILLVPVFKMMPPLYRWRMRSRIFKLYDRLDELDPDKEELQAMEASERQRRLAELTLLDLRAHDLKVPLAFSDRLYHLRQHIELVRRELQKTAAADSQSHREVS